MTEFLIAGQEFAPEPTPAEIADERRREIEFLMQPGYAGPRGGAE